MVDGILLDIDTKMRKTLDILIRELATLRTSRATPALVEHLRIDYHGIPTPLNHLASITAPEPRLLVIQPWDRTTLPSIEKAILRSDLGLNPTSDGSMIRLVIPPLNEERRKELVKVVRKRIEEGRIALRNLRREGLDRLREQEKNKEISTDQCNRALDRLQKLTDSFIEQVNTVGKAKETELMEI